MPDAAVLATMLLLFGLFLLGLEFFIPSFGMILALACISLVVSFWSACKAWWGVNPAFFWTYVVVLIAGIPVSLLSAITVMQKTSFGNRMILRPPPPVDRDAENPLDELIGKRGVAQTLLTPGGMVLINEERFHAESLGMLVEPQTPVVVVAIRANRIVVRPWTTEDESLAQKSGGITQFDPTTASPKSAPVAGQTVATPDETGNGNRLDFEIPDDYTRVQEAD